jgi:hypothetical protein
MSGDSMKQPHEGVRGSDRTGNDFLSTDQRAIFHRDITIALARHLYTALRVGDPAPVVQRMYLRITAPQIGDLVVETAKGFYSSDSDTRMKAFGFLVERRREWWHTDEEYAELIADGGLDAADPRPVDEAWYLQYGPAPGDICRWVSCSFIAVPVGGDFVDRAAVSEGTKLVITRDALMRTIIDAGFNLNVPGILDDALNLP